MEESIQERERVDKHKKRKIRIIEKKVIIIMINIRATSKLVPVFRWNTTHGNGLRWTVTLNCQFHTSSRYAITFWWIYLMLQHHLWIWMENCWNIVYGGGTNSHSFKNSRTDSQRNTWTQCIHPPWCYPLYSTSGHHVDILNITDCDCRTWRTTEAI